MSSRANKLKEMLVIFFLNRYHSNFRMCSTNEFPQIINFTHNKLALKTMQNFSPHFGLATKKFLAVIMNRSTVNI